MIDRSHRILGIALVVQVALILLLASPWSAGSGRAEPRALFPDLDPDAVARVEIEAGDDRVALTRVVDGWAVEDRDGFPAEADRVASLIEDVAAVRGRTPVVRSARYHDALGVPDDGFETRVRVAEEDGSTAADLVLGTSPNVGLRHVRAADDDRVYEVRGFDRWNVRADPDTWIDKDLLPDVSAATVRSVRIENAHGTIAAGRDDTGAWTGADGVDVDALVRELAGLRLLEPAGDDAPPLDPAAAEATVEFEIAEGEADPRTVRVHVGPPIAEDDDRRVALRTGPDRRVVLSAIEAERILDAGAPEEAGG